MPEVELAWRIGQPAVQVAAAELLAGEQTALGAGICRAAVVAVGARSEAVPEATADQAHAPAAHEGLPAWEAAEAVAVVCAEAAVVDAGSWVMKAK